MKKLIGFILIASILGCANIAISKEDTITITLEQWERVQLVVAEQTEILQNETARKFYWFQRYLKLKECVRDSLGDPQATAQCLGDKTS